jgi:hypothetical protein
MDTLGIACESGIDEMEFAICLCIAWRYILVYYWHTMDNDLLFDRYRVQYLCKYPFSMLERY